MLLSKSSFHSYTNQKELSPLLLVPLVLRKNSSSFLLGSVAPSPLSLPLLGTSGLLTLRSASPPLHFVTDKLPPAPRPTPPLPYAARALPYAVATGGELSPFQASHLPCAAASELHALRSTADVRRRVRPLLHW